MFTYLYCYFLEGSLNCYYYYYYYHLHSHHNYLTSILLTANYRSLSKASHKRREILNQEIFERVIKTSRHLMLSIARPPYSNYSRRIRFQLPFMDIVHCLNRGPIIFQPNWPITARSASMPFNTVVGRRLLTTEVISKRWPERGIHSLAISLIAS